MNCRGGGDFRPPEISKTALRRDMRQTALDSAGQDLEEILSSFLSQVKNEVTRGHGSKNVADFYNVNFPTVFPQ